MRKLFRTLAAGLCAAVMGLSCFTGCTLGRRSADELTYFVWGNDSDVALMQAIVDGFNAAYPGEKIILQQNAGTYYDNLKTYFAGDAPDIFFMEGGILESFIREGLLLNLQPYIEKAAEAGEPSLTEADLWDANDGYRYDRAANRMGSGDLYAVIKDWSPDFTMIYNKDLIDMFDAERGHYTTEKKREKQNALRASTDYPDRDYGNIEVVGHTLADVVGYPTDASGKYPSATVPMSWAQSELMGYLLSVRNANNQFSIYGVGIDQPLKYAMQAVEMQGTALFTEDGMRINASDSRVVAAYQHFINYQYGTLESMAKFNATTVGGGNGFKTEQIAVTFNGRWAFSSYDWYSLNYGVAPPPTPMQGGDVYCSSVAIAHAVSSTCANPDLAWKFIKYYMTVGQRLTLDEGFNIPGNKTIAQGEYLEVDDPQQQALNRWYVSAAASTHMLTFNPFLDNARTDTQMQNWLPRTFQTNNPITVANALQQVANTVDQLIQDAVARG